MLGVVRVIVGVAIVACVLIAGAGRMHAAGALAVGVCGAYGYSFDFARMGTARRRALTNCSSRLCKVVATIRKDCAAFAIDATRPCGSMGWATGRRLGPAQNTALRECYKHGGKDCVIRGWACDAKG